MYKALIITIAILGLNFNNELKACSVLYYLDSISGKIFVANHEDFWYDTKAYIQINPRAKNKLARLWYGWNDFAQGGINEAGLFFDGAVTPPDSIPVGYHKPIGNLGDEILASCTTIEDAIEFLELKKIALENAHIMLGDSLGNAVVLEWIDGQSRKTYRKDQILVMTNFLLSDTLRGNYPCYRYKSIMEGARQLKGKEVTLLQVGNLLAGASQPPRSDNKNRIGGTLYSSFIDISEMEFILVYKLDNSRLIKLDLLEEFSGNKKKKIQLQKL